MVTPSPFTVSTLPLVMVLVVDVPAERVVSGTLSHAKCPSAAPFIEGGKTRTSSATSLSPTFFRRDANI
jgi:hypothetical protein